MLNKIDEIGSKNRWQQSKNWTISSDMIECHCGEKFTPTCHILTLSHCAPLILLLFRWGDKSELLGTIQSVLYDKVDYTQLNTNFIETE